MNVPSIAGFAYVTLFFDFSWVTLIFCLISFLIAYAIWPNQRKNTQHEDNPYLDLIELFVELPVNIFLFIFRFIFRFFHKVDNIDF